MVITKKISKKKENENGIKQYTAKNRLNRKKEVMEEMRNRKMVQDIQK